MKKFDIGTLVATRAVAEAMAADMSFCEFVMNSLSRHIKGDWGDLDSEDKELNDESVMTGERLLSAYINIKTNVKIWIITEADRSHTTILYPEEY